MLGQVPDSNFSLLAFLISHGTTEWAANYDDSSKKAKSGINMGGGVICANCYAHFQVQLNFELKYGYVNWGLDKVKVSLSGEARAGLEFTVQASSGLSKTKNFVDMGEKTHFQNINIVICGIPLTLKPSMQLNNSLAPQAQNS